MFRTTIASFRQSFSRALLSDFLVLILLAAMIYGLSLTAQRWTAAYQPAVQIYLDPWHLLGYTFASLFRALIAFLLSLVCTFTWGYCAAYSARAERIILPLLDIAQSIPVLGFLPIAVMALVSLSP
jgi:NitT/TauT family transport system permease protein